MIKTQVGSKIAFCRKAKTMIEISSRRNLKIMPRNLNCALMNSIYGQEVGNCNDITEKLADIMGLFFTCDRVGGGEGEGSEATVSVPNLAG
jgi:hypothetical protein